MSLGYLGEAAIFQFHPPAGGERVAVNNVVMEVQTVNKEVDQATLETADQATLEMPTADKVAMWVPAVMEMPAANKAIMSLRRPRRTLRRARQGPCRPETV